MEKFIEGIGMGIAAILKKIFKGVTRLKNIKRILLFFVFIGIAVAIFFSKAHIFEGLGKISMPGWLQYVVIFLLMAMPVFYLIILDEMENQKQKEYWKIFKEIGFKEKNGKLPYYLEKVEQSNGKTIYLFKTNMAIKDWQGAKERLEAGLDCNILRVSNKGSKKVIQLDTMSTDHKIPKEINWSDDYIDSKDGVIVIGQGALDKLSFNLNRTPHVLIAGETGSGKSVILRSCLWQMIFKGSKVYMIDFKGGVEFGKKYEKYGEVITDRKRALVVLSELCEENEKRLALFRDLEVKNLPEYNQKTGKNICRIGVFCDEIAEMLDKKGVSKEDKPIFEQLEGKLATLARLSRATGINLFLGVQRPDANVLTGQIKNNVPVRISGRFADKSASEIVLGSVDAVNIPDIKGRFLFKLGNELIEFQAYYFDDDTMLHDINVEIGDMLTKPSVKPTDRAYNPFYDDIEQNPPKVKEVRLEDNPDDLDFDFKNMWSVKENEKDDF